MIKNKRKMTIDKLAKMTQDEFSAIRREMATSFATKDDLKRFATKDDLADGLQSLREEIRGDFVKVLNGVDAIVARFDKAEMDSAADKLLHDRHETALENHEMRIKTLEKVKN